MALHAAGEQASFLQSARVKLHQKVEQTFMQQRMPLARGG